MSLARWKSPTQRSEDPLGYHYGLLRSAKTSIRLAQILPRSGSKAISINLIDSFVTGSGQTQYDALSYVWGDGNRTKTILCNGRRLSVTATLLEALQRFRDSDKLVTLWVDQLCICQERTRERNQQVQMMGEIFKSARKVIVWLGEDFEDSKAGMQLAKHLVHIAQHQRVTELGPSDLELHGLPRRGHKRWKALAAMLRRPWFWRTWIIQEVVLNPTVEFVLGASMLTWDQLESVVTLLEGPIPANWQLDEAISASELPFSRINRIRLRHQRVIATPITPTDLEERVDGNLHLGQHRTDADTDEDDPELLDLLLMSRGLGATDPRDKIYALLGLGKHDVDPDYSMSPESVFTDFALQTLGVVTAKLENYIDLSSRDRDVRRAFVLLACAGTVNQRLANLASWVPDWTTNLVCRPLIFGIDKQRYSAGGSKLGTFDWQYDFGLQLSAILLDTVGVVGSAILDFDLSEDGHANIARWWQEAQQIALTRVARSPGSTNFTDAFEAMRRRLMICKHGYYVGESRRKRRGSLLDDAESPTANASHSIAQTLTMGAPRGRVMFVSSTGYLGLVPLGTVEGDIVVVIRGADVPFVLRPRGEAYELVGEAYVQGVMEGEALSMPHLMPMEVMIR